MDNGVIGRVFKIYSALEDSNPAPDGYQSGGILPDMSVHNVDELLWLTGGLLVWVFDLAAVLQGQTRNLNLATPLEPESSPPTTEGSTATESSTPQETES
jgi:predicted dehydrogenase